MKWFKQVQGRTFVEGGSGVKDPAAAGEASG